MADDTAAGRDASALLQDLSEEERAELERRHYVRKGDDLVWREPEGALRREPLAKLYYVRTPGGVFRVSRLSGKIVEV
jgi:hypothetical protein